MSLSGPCVERVASAGGSIVEGGVDFRRPKGRAFEPSSFLSVYYLLWVRSLCSTRLLAHELPWTRASGTANTNNATLQCPWQASGHRIKLMPKTGTREVSLSLQLNLVTKFLSLWKWVGGEIWKGFGSINTEDRDANRDESSRLVTRL